jgi:hypothetical protein
MSFHKRIWEKFRSYAIDRVGASISPALQRDQSRNYEMPVITAIIV